jgi:hypothetical protein
MNLYDQFATDAQMEKQGIIIDYGPNADLPKVDGEAPHILFRIARAGGANQTFNKVLERLTRPHRRMIQSGHMDTVLADQLYEQAFIESILLGWDNVTNKAGEPLPYSKLNAAQLFKDLPELYRDLREQANNSSLFREEQREADLGNSGMSSATDSSKGQ